MENEQKPTKSPKKKQPLPDYAKYSAMGIQMLAIMLLGTYAGIKLDETLGLKKFPVFTILLALLSVAGALYFVLKDLIKKK